MGVRSRRNSSECSCARDLPELAVLLREVFVWSYFVIVGQHNFEFSFWCVLFDAFFLKNGFR